MNDLKKFIKGIPSFIWALLGILFILICFLPFLLTRHGFISFSETGQIGDTIGGIMGPFIAIIAALLTFIAFWVQFEANRELIKENRRNHFENQFYKMLDIHLTNVSSLNSIFAKTEGEKESAFFVFCEEIKGTFLNISKSEVFYPFLERLIREYESEQDKGFILFVNRVLESEELQQKVLYEIVFAFFLEEDFSRIWFENHECSIYVRRLGWLYHSFLSGSYLRLTGKAKSEYLGHYFRHLFQTVEYIDSQDDELFDEKRWKHKFINLLRSQMSDYEQLLLYYNAQSSLGSIWDENHFIEKYHLIENIPYDEIGTCAGESPAHRYNTEIQAAKKRGEYFFEKSR